ncbi:hypothetical protein BSZ35_12580 [Salinibacter sp. 10B]|nr:hypothetical protein BSZ35_12580 [Salinibacter sp. 10B]
MHSFECNEPPEINRQPRAKPSSNRLSIARPDTGSGNLIQDGKESVALSEEGGEIVRRTMETLCVEAKNPVSRRVGPAATLATAHSNGVSD